MKPGRWIQQTVMTLILGAMVSAGAAASPEGSAQTEVLEDDGRHVEILARVRHHMGESESRTDAREIAREHARAAAADRAGIYVERRTETADGELESEEITTLAAGLVESKLRDEDIQVDEQGRLTYRLTLHARVDRSTLDRRIRKLAEDPAKREEIERLREERNTLARRLESLTERMRKGAERDVAARRSEIIRSLDDNRNQVRATFSEGSLLDVAEAQDAEFTALLDESIDAFWRRIRDGLRVDVADVSVSPEGRERDVDVTVEIDDSAALREAHEWLGEHLSVRDYSDPRGSIIGLKDFRNRDEHQKRPYSQELLEHLQQGSVVVRASIPDPGGSRTYESRLDTWVESRLCGHMSGWTCLRDHERAVLTIESVPEHVLQGAEEVTVEVVVTTPEGHEL